VHGITLRREERERRERKVYATPLKKGKSSMENQSKISNLPHIICFHHALISIQSDHNRKTFFKRKMSKKKESKKKGIP